MVKGSYQKAFSRKRSFIRFVRYNLSMRRGILIVLFISFLIITTTIDVYASVDSCNDGICDAELSEDCNSCSSDCGECPIEGEGVTCCCQYTYHYIEENRDENFCFYTSGHEEIFYPDDFLIDDCPMSCLDRILEIYEAEVPLPDEGYRDPTISSTFGIPRAVCDASKCKAAIIKTEICNEVDDDNDGLIDEGGLVDCNSLDVMYICAAGSCSITGGVVRSITGMAGTNEAPRCYSSVCQNNKPSANEPVYLGPVYKEEDGSFRFKKYAGSDNDKSGWFMGNNIKEEILGILKKQVAKISDDNTKFSDLFIGFGKIEKDKIGRVIVPKGGKIQKGEDKDIISFTALKVPDPDANKNNPCEGKEELPVRKEFWMKLTDDGTSKDENGNFIVKEDLIKSSEPIKASALFCPSGKLIIVSPGSYLYAQPEKYVGLIPFVFEWISGGELEFKVKDASIDILNGNCRPNLEVDLNFRKVAGEFMDTVYRYSPVFEPYDIKIKDTSTMEIIKKVIKEEGLNKLMAEGDTTGKTGVASNVFLNILMKIDDNENFVVDLTIKGSKRKGVATAGGYTDFDGSKYSIHKVLDYTEFTDTVTGVLDTFRKNNGIDFSIIKPTEADIKKERIKFEKLFKERAKLSEEKINQIKENFGILEFRDKISKSINFESFKVLVASEGKPTIVTESEFRLVKLVVNQQLAPKFDFVIPKYNDFSQGVSAGAEFLSNALGSSFDYYWFYTDKEIKSTDERTDISYNQRIRPDSSWLSKFFDPVHLFYRSEIGDKLEGCPSQRDTWWVFDKKVKETIVTRGIFREYHEYPPLYKMYNLAFPLEKAPENSLNLKIWRKSIVGDYYQMLPYESRINAKWELKTTLDMGKLYKEDRFNKEEIFGCCPKLQMQIEKFKDYYTKDEKTNSIYYLFESNESIKREEIAYQFLPAYTFNTDVIKFFNLSLFENPVYFKEDDSLLNNCQYDVLGSVSSVIGPDGGEIVLPDEADNVDKVLEVKQTIPEGALDESVEFVIRRINISNCVCYNNIQDGDENGVDCGGRCGACEETCYDGIQNQDETGIDVGGVCIMESISNAEEPCEWDLNQDGETKTCVECAEDRECSNYSCGGYVPVCRGGQCDCLTFDFYYDDKTEFLRLIERFAKGKINNTNYGDVSLFVKNWVNGIAY